jgi:sarcosine oxidase subunit beta
VIAILGGGVAGAALALALTTRGRRDVVVFDPRAQAEGSTGKAFGGFRTQHGSALNVELSLASRPFFATRGGSIGFRPVGYLYLATSHETAAELARRAEQQRELGLPIEHPEAAAMVPYMATEAVLATNFCRLDATYLPVRVLGCMVEEATASGAEFRYGCEATEAEIDGAETVAVCAGTWSREVGERLGVALAVNPLERGIFQVGPFHWLGPDVPVTLHLDSGYHFRERDGRLLVIGPGDPQQWDHHREWLKRFVPQAAVERPEAHWTGFYEMTFDHHPLVGATERPGIFASCGFSGHGVMHSPAIGDCLAAIMLGETPNIDISALSPLRREALVDLTQL